MSEQMTDETSALDSTHRRAWCRMCLAFVSPYTHTDKHIFRTDVGEQVVVKGQIRAYCPRCDSSVVPGSIPTVDELQEMHRRAEAGNEQ